MDACLFVWCLRSWWVINPTSWRGKQNWSNFIKFRRCRPPSGGKTFIGRFVSDQNDFFAHSGRCWTHPLEGWLSRTTPLQEAQSSFLHFFCCFSLCQHSVGNSSGTLFSQVPACFGARNIEVLRTKCTDKTTHELCEESVLGAVPAQKNGRILGSECPFIVAQFLVDCCRTKVDSDQWADANADSNAERDANPNHQLPALLLSHYTSSKIFNTCWV